MAAARCPHGCRRCQALEAGHPGPFTPAEFIELFGVEDTPSSNGWHAEETLAAAGLLETAESVYRRANDALGGLILEGRDDPASREALTLAGDERTSAAELLSVARVRYYELAKADERRRLREEYQAGQEAMAEARRERDAERRRGGEGVLVRLRKGRS